MTIIPQRKFSGGLRGCENDADDAEFAQWQSEVVFYFIKKEGNFRIFQARDRAIDDFAYREDPKLVRAFDAQ
jgi:hypothetical protein